MSGTKSVLMVLNRNFTLRSTLGHMLTFKKNVPMPIPASMIRACGQIGAERVDGVDVFEEVETEKPPQPVDPGDRQEDISSAIIDLVETNDSRNFTAAGAPKVDAVSQAVGYKVDRTEVTKAWRQRAEDLENESE